jgi:NADPH-dependent 2,4-dienoyl-CoA reductase/sulfur reductase-like enzyme/rhodanese-related sulfurtransferase
MSAATRARRMNEDASIIVLEKSGFISFANCGLPYYLAGRIDAENKLLITNAKKVYERFNIEARVKHEVTLIDRDAKEVEVRDDDAGTSYRLAFDKLILAPGATPILPSIDQADSSRPNVFLLRSMEDTRRIQRWLAEEQPRTAVIVGAGFIGLEMAEALHERGLRVTIVEKAAHVLPPLDAEMAEPLAQELVKNGVEVVTGMGLQAVWPGGKGLAMSVEVEDEAKRTGQSIPADMVLLSMGVRPNTSLARAAALAIGPSGAIAVDRYQRTSDPDIYAVGDASEVTHGVSGAKMRIPLAGPANRQGRLAGEHAATGSSAPAARVFGTAIVQVFGLAAGLTGLGEEVARKAGFEVDTSYVFAGHHAGYYPGAEPILIKLIYDKPSGKVLGGQAVGCQGVDKRLDIIATILHFGGTIDDLAALDLAYAPQFASAKDPVHLTAMVAQNQRCGNLAAVGPTAINGELLLDVRTPAEHAAGSLPGAINIPLEELRQRLGELAPDRSITVFCQVGLRGYVATRLLMQHGFQNVRNLKGGYRLAMLSAPRMTSTG